MRRRGGGGGGGEEEEDNDEGDVDASPASRRRLGAKWGALRVAVAHEEPRHREVELRVPLGVRSGGARRSPAVSPSGRPPPRSSSCPWSRSSFFPSFFFDVDEKEEDAFDGDDEDEDEEEGNDDDDDDDDDDDETLTLGGRSKRLRSSSYGTTQSKSLLRSSARFRLSRFLRCCA